MNPPRRLRAIAHPVPPPVPGFSPATSLGLTLALVALGLWLARRHSSLEIV